MPRKPPANVSVASSGDGARQVAPAASRNVDAIRELVTRIAPDRGRALELASGTGQHVAELATHLPNIEWQPSEVSPERRSSIDAYGAQIRSIAPCIHLDATRPGWGIKQSGQDLILLVNLLHLISVSEVRTLIREAASALVPGGRFLIYGPFMRNGVLTSDGDKRFHASLAAHDSEIGYKNDRDVLEWLNQSGLETHDPITMPANNLAILATKPG